MSYGKEMEVPYIAGNDYDVHGNDNFDDNSSINSLLNQNWKKMLPELFDLGVQLGETCFQMYNQMESGLSPEAFDACCCACVVVLYLLLCLFIVCYTGVYISVYMGV
jgi:hypothetical protein